MLRLISIFVVIGLTLLSFSTVAASDPPANRNFLTTWQRTDLPVAAQQVNRTWMWGPDAFTGPLLETYGESPGGKRSVQFFDKSRMEITNPGSDSNSIWYVTNGLLVMELVTGRLQLGDNLFEEHEPAEINIAGDAGDPSGPTYATTQSLVGQPPVADAATITQRVDRAGNITDDPSLAVRGVTASYFVPETNHQVASPFWDFMTSTGLTYGPGGYTNDQLFQNPFFATGFPIAEAYWATVQVAGVAQDVLMQCFERRCLTYTPGNDPGWQVESGNVGRHYYEWRYDALDNNPELMPLPTTGDVRVVFILADPPDLGESVGEYVDIQNFSDNPVDMTGWRLEDAAGAKYTFPAFTLGLDAVVRVHVCDGQNTSTELFWGRCSATWNNGGDTAYLFDSSGQQVDAFSY